MLNRRLIILFVLFAGAMAGLALRLGQLQISEAEKWQAEARTFVHRHTPIETARGSIVDRNGVIVAQDVHCYDLAIDYRAMNRDDRWITRTARQRLRERDVVERKEILEQLPREKELVANLLLGIPEAIRQQCGISREEVRARFNEIHTRISLLRQDRWSRVYSRNKDREDGVSVADADLKNEIKEETVSHTVVPNIRDGVANYFRQHAGEYPGLVVVDSQRRDYPYKDVACHLIGVMRPIDKAWLDRERLGRNLFDLPNLLTEEDTGNLGGYLPGDRAGEMGIEALEEKKLRGVRGVKLMELGSADAERRIEPRQGGHVQMTLDIKLQEAIEKAVMEPSGKLRMGADNQTHAVAIVVLDMEGRVLVMYSSSTYDLNLYDEQRVELNTNTEEMPLINRALSAAYPPGSTIKPLVAAAALSEGLVRAQETITCNGHLFANRKDQFRCLRYVNYGLTHGPLPLSQAMEVSCNIYFYTLGQRLGLERFLTWLDVFSLGRDTGFELRTGNVDGNIPSREVLQDASTAAAESLQLGIGQGRLAVTPLQMANAYATMLRGGEEIAPRILASTPEVRTKRAVISPATVAALREGMELVVHGEKGTARTVFAGMKMRVAGKTGSAMTGRKMRVQGLRVDGDSDAWFVGYVPADKPQYVISAVMEFGGHGGSNAAPMVRETVVQMENFGYLPKVD